jgi:hypothetical protein
VTTTTLEFDHLVMNETSDGHQIEGFVSGETQARIVFDRRGERLEIVCVTESLACIQLSLIEELPGWTLVSAALEPCQRGGSLSG